MFSFLFKLGLLSSVVCSCVKKHEGDDGVVGGEDIDILEVPYQVSIMRSGIYNCGGSIVDNYIIVTAAHCLDNVRPESITIRVGTSFRQYGGEIHFVNKFIQHPSYTRTTLDYDVAIIRLSEPLSFRDTVKPINMADVGDEIPDGAGVVVTGWGWQKEWGEVATTLQRVVLPKVNHNDCVQAYKQVKNISSRMMCAGLLEGGKNACRGDSGGPVVYNNKLAGIVSWSAVPCARPGFPGVNAKVAALREWIDDNIAKLKANI